MSEQEQTNLPVIHLDMNFGQLAEALVAYGEGRIELSPEQDEMLKTLLVSKTDNWAEFVRECEFDIMRLEAIAAEFQGDADKLQKKLTNSLNYVANVMAYHQLERIPGEKFQVTLSKSTYCEVPDRKPTELDFKELGKDFVRKTEKVELSWDKTNMTKALKAGKFPFNIASLKERLKPVFEPKKGR